MQQEIIISGFGGQGTLFAGQLLAYAAMDNDRHVTWLPSYGPEMRGGKVRCTVIIADEEIGAAAVRHPGAVIALNIPSFEMFDPLVKPGGVLVVNSSLVPRTSDRDDIQTLYIPGTDVATEMGHIRLANMVCLGALIESTGVATIEEISEALENHLPERHRKLLPANHEALRRGATLAAEVLTGTPVR